MRFKGTAVLFVLLAILAGWVYWTEIRGREEREAAEEAAGKVLPVEAAEIQDIQLVSPDQTLEAMRAGTGWEFVTPPGLEADAAGWDQVAADVARIERGDPVTSTPEDLGQYGLDAPSLQVIVKLSDGGTEDIRFGSPNPSGKSNYTSLASSPDVFLTATSWRGMFLKEPDDLRDKTLLKFEQGDIDRIALEPSGIELELGDEGWFIAGPPRLRADDSEVQSFLSALRTTRASGFAAPDVPDPAAGPSAQVTLTDRATDQPHVLIFGGESEEGSGLVYASDQSREPIFTVMASLRDRVLSPVSVWRDKTITELDPDAVERIRIERGGESLELEKAGETWTLSDGREASAMRVGDLLRAFDFQEASEVIDAPGPLSSYGLEPPEIHVVFAGSGGDLLDFGFGGTEPGGTGVYWKSAAEAPVKVVPAGVRAPFDVSAADLLPEAAAEEAGPAQ